MGGWVGCLGGWVGCLGDVCVCVPYLLVGKCAHSRPRCVPVQDEDWISELVERLWPYTRSAIEAMTWEMMPGAPACPPACLAGLTLVAHTLRRPLLPPPSFTALLEASKPSWVHALTLQKLELGSKEPDLSGIK